MPTADDLLDSSDDAPAIRLINGVIADAVRQGVSDIHVEPYETGLIVRMRIDGVAYRTLLDADAVTAVWLAQRREDVSAMALPVLRHRIVPTFNAEASGKDENAIVRQLLDDLRASAKRAA